MPRPRFVLAWLLLALAATVPVPTTAQEAPDTYPASVLRNPTLTLKVYRPDPKVGYYRGSRFDWSGQIAQAALGMHTFFGDWRSPHNPTNHDDATGPAGEFGMQGPLGYDEAKAGEPVLKIGVGLIRKEDEPKYVFYQNYTVLDPGTWTEARGEGWIEWTQTVDGPRGWGYRYTKRLTIDAEAARFTLSHTLRNTGTKRIATDYYVHNFFRIDGSPAGPDYRITFPFPPAPDGAVRGPLRLDGRAITFERPVPDGSDAYVELQGFGAGAEDNQVVVTNRRTGATATVVGDRPLTAFHVWSAPTAVCPEPFVAIDVAPGAEQAWQVEFLLSERAP